MGQTPARQMMEEALKEFRAALVSQGVYERDHQNLDRACNGAKDFVDFLLDGPGVLRKNRPRKNA
jgi:hypothetical protein